MIKVTSLRSQDMGTGHKSGTENIKHKLVVIYRPGDR